MANDSLDFVQRGKVSIVRRQYADAVKICRLGLLAHPTLLEGRLVLGMALTALQRWDEVLAEMRVALEVDGQNALAWLLKGEALVGKGDFLQAESTLKRAKELDPSNTKADQLLAEIQVARAAGFEGIPAEPTDTKVYPAKAGGPASDDREEKLSAELPALSSGSVADLPGVRSAAALERSPYESEETTEVDPDPSGRIPSLLGAKKPEAPTHEPARLSRLNEEGEEVSTEMFFPPPGGHEEPFGEVDSQISTARARKPTPASLSDEPSRSGIEIKTPLEMPRHQARKSGQRPAVNAAGEPSEPSIQLSSADLIATTGSGRVAALNGAGDSVEPVGPDDPGEPGEGEEEYEDEDTRQRRQRMVDTNVGTRPETPEPVRRRVPRPTPRVSPLPPPSSNDAPTGAAMNPDHPPVSRPGLTKAGAARGGTRAGGTRAPIRTAPAQPIYDSGLAARLRYALTGERQGGSVWLFVTALVAVVAVGVVGGLLLREWRMRARVAKRHELARQKLATGNYPGFQTAELLYRQILAERDDLLARRLRARTLAQMAFEFGDPPDVAARAVAALGESDTSPEAQGARVFLAMAHGELDRAGRLATALRRQRVDPVANYLVGRAELLLERPDSAAEALRAAAEKDAHDPMVLHALGLAEAAAHHDEPAMAAFKQALSANANHIATIVDRAILQVRRGPDAEREAARGALEGVTQKLAADASPGQLARAFLGLGELELAKGDLEAARRDLQAAMQKRLEGDALFEEELAGDLARAFELDAAEKEARRAVAGFGASARLGPRLVLAEVALLRGRAAQALATIEEAGTSRPEALVLRSQAQLQLGRKEAARLDAESALHVAPDLTAAKVALARVDIADGHPDRAQRDLERLDRGQKLPEVAEALGESFLTRNPERARQWLGEALKRDTLRLDARYMLARLDHDAGKLDEAQKQLSHLLLLNPNYLPARRELAAVALDQGDGAAARDQFDALAEKEPDLETLTGAARAHLQLGDGAGAESWLKKAQALPFYPTSGPQAEEAADLLAHALLLQHRADEAVTVLRKVAPGATRGETGGLLMTAYLDIDQPDKAAGVRFLIPPRLFGSAEMLTARARLMVERGRDVAAEALATEAVARLSPKLVRGVPQPSPLDRLGARRWVRAEALTVLGRSQWEQGAFTPALKSLKSATELDPHSGRAFYYYGLVLEELKRLPEAREAMAQAVKADPKLADALYSLGRLQKDANDPKAVESFQAYLQVAPKGIYADEAKKVIAGSSKPALKPTSSLPRKRRRGR